MKIVGIEVSLEMGEYILTSNLIKGLIFRLYISFKLNHGQKSHRSDGRWWLFVTFDLMLNTFGRMNVIS